MKAIPTLRGILAAILAASAISFVSAQTQEPARQAKRPQLEELTPEQKKAFIVQRLNEITESYALEMGDLGPTDEQSEAFAKTLVTAQISQMSLRTEMQKLRKNKDENGNRDAMAKLAGKRQEIDATLLKEMKAILSKEQFKAFKKAKEKLQPTPQERPRRPPGGGGGGGGSGRGAGGGGGGGGGGEGGDF